jgi:uncharacterized protein YxeA
MKKKITIIIVLLIILGIIIFSFNKNNSKNNNNSSNNTNYEKLLEFTNDYDVFVISSDQEYNENKEKISSLYLINRTTYDEQDFEKLVKENKKFLFLTLYVDSCSEQFELDYVKLEDKNLNVFLTNYNSCGVCAAEKLTYVYEIDVDGDIENIEVYLKNIVQDLNCDSNIAYKPIIYIYPEKEMDLSITLENKEVLTYTYPKYNNIWNIHVNLDGTIYDYETKRNYYALYWEGIDNTSIDTSTGFVVAGKDTVSFLEEKLAYLGLNEREINEFIIYWIDKLEGNNYNYIHFRTTDEMNEYMPIKFSTNPDTLIRVMMDYAPLKEKIEVKEQKLIEKTRSGFTVVEWGGEKINL